MNRKIITTFVVVLIIGQVCAISCSGNRISKEERFGTEVAQTVEAYKTQAEPSLTDTPAPTKKPKSKATKKASATPTKKIPPTQTPRLCNNAEYISETIPDNTEIGAGVTFTKSWRLKNVGTCTWNTLYELRHGDGNRMNGPTKQKLTQLIVPGEQVDVLVELKAPTSEGTYEGSWKIVDDQGTKLIDGLDVKIKVGPAPLKTYSKTLDAVSAEGGEVLENGDKNSGDYRVGDTSGNNGIQSFASFDISSIPSDATISEVKVDFTSFSTTDDPFGDLGCLRLYPDPYRPLDAGDYKTPPVSGPIVSWCSENDLDTESAESELADYLESRLGSNYMPVRLQFNTKQSDNDSTNDYVNFTKLSLDITYKAD